MGDKLFRGSPEQEKFWQVFLDSDDSVIMNSVAGSGKTFTGVQACMRDKHSDIAYVAFNKHIQVELTKKIAQPNVTCMTYHGLGFKALRLALKKVEVDEHGEKLDNIIENIIPVHMPENRRGYIKVRVRKLVSLCKQYCVKSDEELTRLVDHHTVDISGIEDEVYDYTPQVLNECKAQKHLIDYDDMVWLPQELGIKMPRYDVMLIDEAQDTNMAQQWLALQSSDRLIVIGDPNQAIYGFRGSDVESMNRLRDALKKRKHGVKEMSLSYTRRCPKSHVDLAQMIVPKIQALKDAPKGLVKSISDKECDRHMQPGDMVLCRVNGELMKVAYGLIKRGVKAVVRGRDVGDGVIKLIEKAEKKAQTSDAKDILKAAYDITQQEISKYNSMPNGRGQNRADNSRDRYECLENLAVDANSASDLIKRVTKIFSDFDDSGKPNNAVVLGTVHRTKGLEANRIFVLKPDLIPHPMAKKEWEVQQERNLAYVAVTRAVYNRDSNGELIWIGGQPSIFNKPEKAIISSEAEQLALFKGGRS